jgi:hypothetical protein
MQKLWGRVLAGQIRKPGKFSMRTLRFLSEFSQEDAVRFAEVANVAFGDSAPKSLLVSEETKDIRPLMHLEAAGLIDGVMDLGVTQTLPMNENGLAFLSEGGLSVVLRGQPNSSVKHQIIALTPVGTELLALIPERNKLDAARRVAFAIRTPDLKAAMLAVAAGEGQVRTFEVLWDDEAQPSMTEPQASPLSAVDVKKPQ